MTDEPKYCWHCSCELTDGVCLGPDGERSDCPPQPTVFSAAVYLVDRSYGGPEEGGWWFDCGEPVLDEDLPFPAFFKDEAEAYIAARAMQKTLDAGINVGRPNINSVLSQGVYRAIVCDGMPRPFPEKTPHYE